MLVLISSTPKEHRWSSKDCTHYRFKMLKLSCWGYNLYLKFQFYGKVEVQLLNQDGELHGQHLFTRDTPPGFQEVVTCFFILIKCLSEISVLLSSPFLPFYCIVPTRQTSQRPWHEGKGKRREGAIMQLKASINWGLTDHANKVSKGVKDLSA